MENKSYDSIVGSSSAPYLTHLASVCGLATNYVAVAHPSLPNYLAATSGDTWGVTDDSPPSDHPIAHASIFSQLSSAGMTWRSYEEGMPATCGLSSSGEYAVKHDPAAYYTGIRADCRRWDVPFSALSADLRSSRLPSFSFVTPNLCDDMHDCPVSTGDAWLSAWIPAIVRSPAYQSRHTAIVITFDEDDGAASNHVATLVVSPATPRGARSAQPFTHYSLLRTSEYLFGARFLGGAAHATGLSRAFRLY